MDAARKKLVRARTALLLEHPFFGSLCLRMEPRPDPNCATAWTDGRTLAYNPVFVASLRDEQVQGLMAHTVMHPACQHHVRRGRRDHALWNEACDHAINWILLDAGITLPPKYLDNPAFHGLTADEIYARLHTHRSEENRPVRSEGDNESDEEIEAEEDESAEKASREGDGEDDASGGEADGEGGTDDGSAGDEPAEEGAEVFGDPGGSGEVRDGHDENDGGGGGNPSPDESWELALSQAAQAAREIGDLPGGLERLVNDVLTPTADWRELLSRYICERARDDYSWTPPNKRFLHLDVILPSLSHRRLPEIVLAMDTSGSVTEPEMDRFAAELSAILEEFDTTVHVVYCDAAVGGAQAFARADLPLDLNPVGGGGTDFRPVFQWVEQAGLAPGCLIYLTDLECHAFPEREPDYPVLWARVGQGDRTPPFGELIEITREGL
jgi:predicted metal-dependent peptidase